MLTLCNIHWHAHAYGNKNQQLTMTKIMDHISYTITQMLHYKGIHCRDIVYAVSNVHLTYKNPIAMCNKIHVDTSVFSFEKEVLELLCSVNVITFYIAYKYKIRSMTNNSIPEMAENMLQMIEKNSAPDLHDKNEVYNDKSYCSNTKLNIYQDKKYFTAY